MVISKTDKPDMRRQGHTSYDIDFERIRDCLIRAVPVVVAWAPGDGTRYEIILTPLAEMWRERSNREYAFPGAAVDDVFVAMPNMAGNCYTFNLLHRAPNDTLHAGYIAEHMGIQNQATLRVMTELLNRIAHAEPYQAGLEPAEIASFG